MWDSDHTSGLLLIVGITIVLLFVVLGGRTCNKDQKQHFLEIEKVRTDAIVKCVQAGKTPLECKTVF